MEIVHSPTPPRPDYVGMLPSEHARQLILNLLATRGKNGATEQELQRLLELAHDAYADWLLFQCAVQREMEIDLIDGEMHFRLPKGNSA